MGGTRYWWGAGRGWCAEALSPPGRHAEQGGLFPTGQKLWSTERVGGQAEPWRHGWGTAGRVETPSHEQLGTRKGTGLDRAL